MAKSNHFVLGFVLGTATALATTYLLSPKSTADLKKRLKSSGSQLGERATDYYEYAKDATSDLRSSAEELVTGLKTKLHSDDDDLDLDSYDEETAELRGAVTDSSDDDDDEDFDDIVVDGKSAFAQAKDEATPTADEAQPKDAAADDAAKPADDSAADAAPDDK